MVGKMRKSGEDAKVAGLEKGKRKVLPLPSVVPIYIFFMVVLSQFSGPDHLGTWNRLSHPEFQILGHACRENNGRLATFYLLGFFNPFFLFVLLVIGHLH